MSTRATIFELINIECENQVLEWGEQKHNNGLWMLILAEEVGEAAREFLQGRISSGCYEMIQAAAVIVSWVEKWIKERSKIYSDIAVKLTTGLEDHPRDYEGPCNCRVCQSYADC